jgi:hypothetical protein
MVPLRLDDNQDSNNHDQDEKNPHSNTLPIPAAVTYTNVAKTKRAGARVPVAAFRGGRRRKSFAKSDAFRIDRGQSAAR